jgi:hypothetical protein
MKSFQHAATVEVTSNRELFTKHGLHLNSKGKEQAAKAIASLLKEVFKLQEKGAIKMRWKDEQQPEGAATVLNIENKDDHVNSNIT